MTLWRAFPAFLTINFIYCFAVILWGALVRATGSGAGCGAHWPLCHGEVLIVSASSATIIEFVHRAMSGAFLVTVMIGSLLSFRLYPPGHGVRIWSVVAVVFVLVEAAIGAILVLFELTGENTSPLRGYVMGAHLINTFFLVAAQGIHLAQAVRHIPLKDLRGALSRPLLLTSVVGMLVLSSTGAMVALGDTLFPASSLAEGFQQTHAGGAHLLVQLRTVHPLLAMAVGLIILIYAGELMTQDRLRSSRSAKIGVCLVVVVMGQLLFGVVNWLLLVPLWSQLVHLAGALALWLVLLWSMIEATGNPAPSYVKLPKI